ncbi:Lrp/AsnC family transcriptional regulator [Microbispora hainanensis]|uniref:Lrp/AsnC family transcriptional regulator n=1 Tax=Microbispora hainanensis TaxID=568844 RepID=UPI0033FE910F
MRALARDLALGDSTVSVRLRRLRDSGALTAIRVEVNPAALGRPIRVACRSMDDLELAVATLRDAGADTTCTQIVTRTVTGLGQALLVTIPGPRCTARDTRCA